MTTAKQDSENETAPTRPQYEVDLSELEHEYLVLRFVADKRAELKAQLKELEDTETEALGKIQDALSAGAADAFDGDENFDAVGKVNGESKVVWVVTHQSRFDSAKLKTVAPDLYKSLTKRTTVKTFKVL